MKRPVEWHEECLANFLDGLESARLRAEQAAAHVARMEKAADFSRRQIAEAKRQGKDGFDSDRFMRNTHVEQ